MKKYSILFPVYVLLASICCTIVANPVFKAQNTAIVFDLDDTITTNYRLDISDFVREIKHMTPHLQTKAGQKHLDKLEAIGRELTRKKSDVTSAEIINAMIYYLKKQGYKNENYNQQLMALAIQPVAIDSMIKLLHELKKDGYILIAATNQNYNDHLIYRTKLKAKNLDLTKIFDSILTAYSKNCSCTGRIADDSQYMGDQTFMANESKKKPNSSYFAILKKIGAKQGAQHYFFIDDQEKNVSGASWAGIHATQYKLPLYRPGIPAREFLDKLDHSTNQIKSELQIWAKIAE